MKITAIVISLICAVVVCFTMFSTSCITNPDGTVTVDWEKADATGDAGLKYIDQQIKIWEHDPKTVEKLTGLRSAVSAVDKEIDAIRDGTGSTDALDVAIGIAVKLVDEWFAATDPQDQSKLALLSSISGGLSLIKVIIA